MRRSRSGCCGWRRVPRDFGEASAPGGAAALPSRRSPWPAARAPRSLDAGAGRDRRRCAALDSRAARRRRADARRRIGAQPAPAAGAARADPAAESVGRDPGRSRRAAGASGAPAGPTSPRRWRRIRSRHVCSVSRRWGWRRSSRPRVHPPLHELLQGPPWRLRRCACGAGWRGDAVSRRRCAPRPRDLAALQADPVAWPRSCAAHRAHACAAADPALPPAGYVLEEADIADGCPRLPLPRTGDAPRRTGRSARRAAPTWISAAGWARAIACRGPTDDGTVTGGATIRAKESRRDHRAADPRSGCLARASVGRPAPR